MIVVFFGPQFFPGAFSATVNPAATRAVTAAAETINEFIWQIETGG